MEKSEFNSAEVMKNLLKALRYGARPFAAEIQVTPMSIYHILKGSNSISNNLIDKIVKKFPNVHYWYLVNGRLPILLENPKLIQNQDSLLNATTVKNVNSDYSLESFVVLKSIESKMDQILELLSSQKKADN